MWVFSPTGRRNYFEACVEYLEGAKQSLKSGGVSQLVSDGYETYLEHPSGPYVFCFNQANFSVDAIGESVLVLHPFTPNNTLEDLVGRNQEELALLTRKAELISSALANGTLNELFNYTEPYSQDKSLVEGGIQIDNEEKQLIGFVDRLDDSVVQCGCRYTGVPDGERDNSNAIKSEGESAASMGSMCNNGILLLLLVFIIII